MLPAVLGQLPVAREPVADYGDAALYVPLHEGADVLAGTSLQRLQRLQRHPVGMPSSSISTAPITWRMPTFGIPWLAMGSCFERSGTSVSSTSTNPMSRQRSGLTMARRSLCSSSHAILWEPMPSCAWACSAEIPFEWLVSRWMAPSA